MEKITLIKAYRQNETMRLLGLTDILEQIRSRAYEEATQMIRNAYPMLDLRREADGSVSGASAILNKLPRICFASALTNRNHQRVNLGYTGLVLLEVNNLTGYDEADAVRKGAGEVPQTLMAFVGASGLRNPPHTRSLSGGYSKPQ